jgi:4a-hydroxytetrahydrobiopterin dehydratase
MENIKLNSEIIHQNLKKLPDWADIDELKINKTFKFNTFIEAIEFINKVAEIAERNNHHPDIHLYFNQVSLELWTSSVQGLSEKDFILATEIEDIFAVDTAENKVASTDY